MMNCLEQDILGQAFEDAFQVLQDHSALGHQYPTECKSYITFLNNHPPMRANDNYFAAPPEDNPAYNWRDLPTNTPDTYFEEYAYHSMQNIQEDQVTCAVHTTTVQPKHGRRKLRLFEYLYEALCNPDTTSCIQWVDRPNGIFQFVSKNKEKLAELWGKKKGNRKIMTYQKMARALRNYARTGEIMKIRRKLTYQFSAVVLERLSPACLSGKDTVYCQYLQPGVEYYNQNCWEVNKYTYNNGCPFNHQFI
ncbi:hypothetical protein FKM82_012446 [Ascaphus truei]